MQNLTSLYGYIPADSRNTITDPQPLPHPYNNPSLGPSPRLLTRPLTRTLTRTLTLTLIAAITLLLPSPLTLARALADLALAEGFLRIAVENMANAIKKISVQRGYDVTGYTLNCFGGAGGQHACLVADALGMTKVLTHPFAGVLSAHGMGLADIRALRERAVETTLEDGAMAALNTTLDELAGEATKELNHQDIADAQIEVLRPRDVEPP